MAKRTLVHRLSGQVEPGLHYPVLGGARHEDVVAITADGSRLLSKSPRLLEI